MLDTPPLVPAATVHTTCLVYNSITFVPHYRDEDTFAAPGGYFVSGSALRALGAITQQLLLWPRS